MSDLNAIQMLLVVIVAFLLEWMGFWTNFNFTNH